MPELSQNLYERCYQTLLKCSEFDSDVALRAVFVVSDLAPFRAGLPGADSKAARVKSVIAYLVEQETPAGDSALVLFLHALSRHYESGNKLHHDLTVVERAVEEENLNRVVASLLPDSPPVPPPTTDRRALIQRLRDPLKYSIGDLHRLWLDYGNPNVAFQILVTQCAGIGDLQACIAEQLVMEAFRRGDSAQLIATMRQI